MLVTERVKKHRDKLRENGYRPIQIWVPDVRIPEFIAEFRKQSQQLKDDPQEKEILDWVGNTADSSEWE
ncbi:hypothetical protein BAZMOX_218857_1 [methanotrophic endosymbiont of Bathymodiolus azoricus (Menez Gwen)]|jgi:hypothetical protein|nr:hypothetical protein BAZMOX_218857_1 [methanotrophic endosymbiont of Bathymodiolus azoricus (Menez Gwen)]